MSKKVQSRLLSSLLLCFLELAPVRGLNAQAVSIATLTGRVTDEQGALVPGAQIRMTAVDTGVVFNAVANTDGIYTIPSLPIGAYTLQASSPGFQTYVQTGILLRVNDHVEINIPMRVGQV